MRAILFLLLAFGALAPEAYAKTYSESSFENQAFQLNATATSPAVASQIFTLCSIQNPVDSGVNIFTALIGFSCDESATLEAVVGNVTEPTNMIAGRAFSCRTDTTTTAKATVMICPDGSSDAVNQGVLTFPMDALFTTTPLVDTQGLFCITPGVRVDFQARSNKAGKKRIRYFFSWREVPVNQAP